MERIEADMLIPGRGGPIHDGCVVLDGPTIAYAGPTAGAPAAGAATDQTQTAASPKMSCKAYRSRCSTHSATRQALSSPDGSAASRAC